MRKLFILTAILFIAPTATGMTISLNDTGSTVELSVFGHGEPDYIYGLAMVIEAPGLLTNFVDGPKAPILWVPFPVTINGDSGQWWRLDFPSQDDEGVWLIADWSASVPVWISAYRGFWTPGGGNLIGSWWTRSRSQSRQRLHFSPSAEFSSFGVVAHR